MTNLACDVIAALSGRTLATAESCTGGGIGATLTAVSGSSQVFRGGIISYCDAVKHALLGVPQWALDTFGAVSACVAVDMAKGARAALQTDIAVSVTGLAGPGGDAFGNPVGTVFIGYCDDACAVSREYHFCGNREDVRQAAVEAALRLILEYNPLA